MRAIYPQADVVLIQNNALLMIVIAVGQIVGQLCAADNPIAYVGSLPMPEHLIVVPALIFEALGIMHVSWVFSVLF